ncbi:aminotransferase class I/II-fold pyridoxal phosphate-dependent enzyme, partial [Pseudomonas kulmbachensis]
VLDLNFNYPSLPGQAELLRTALRQLALSGDLEALLRYQPHAGRVHERAAVARHLLNRGLTVPAEQVLVVSGAQHGLAVSMMTLLKPGDVVAVDALTYSGFKVLAETLHLELVAIPVTASGPDLDHLHSLCRQRPVRAVYSMPTLHN